MLVPNQIVSNNHQRHNLRGQKYFCLFKEGVISLAVVSGLFVAASFYKTAYLFFYHASKTGSRQESALQSMFGPWNIYVGCSYCCCTRYDTFFVGGDRLFFYIEETFARLRRRNKVESLSASNIIGNSGFLLIVV